MVGKPTNWFSLTSSFVSSIRSPTPAGNSFRLFPSKHNHSSLFSFCILLGKPTNWLPDTNNVSSSFRSQISGGSSANLFLVKTSLVRFFSLFILVDSSVRLLSFSSSSPTSPSSVTASGTLDSPFPLRFNTATPSIYLMSAFNVALE